MYMISSQSRTLQMVGVVVAAILVTAAAALPARAAPAPTTVADRFVGPLGLAVGSDGTIYVGEGFSGVLTSVDRHGNRTTLGGNGMDVAGVDAVGRGTVAFVQTLFDQPAPGEEFGRVLAATLESVRPNKRGTTTVASLLDHETATNPDGGISYGFEGVADDCLATLPEFIPAAYTGIIDSHPFGVAITAGGWAVADAAANDVLRVDHRGRVSTVAVLPRVRNVLTAEAVEQFGLDDCLIGATYWGEPVPTDVEVGPDGTWYVTTLPGGPELPGTGAVWRIDPATGDASMVADGLDSAVDLAVADDGTIYVAELFANRISTIVDGTVAQWAEVTLPGAVEVSRDGTVYATTDALGVGPVVAFTP